MAAHTGSTAAAASRRHRHGCPGGPTRCLHCRPPRSPALSCYSVGGASEIFTDNRPIHAQRAEPVRGWPERSGALDEAIFRAIVETPTPAIDAPLRALSRAADNGRLWIGTSACLSLAGRQGRRAALSGLGSLALASAVANLAVKQWAGRSRPLPRTPAARHVAGSRLISFPSGHAASAFAFAVGAGSELPGRGAAAQSRRRASSPTRASMAASTTPRTSSPERPWGVPRPPRSPGWHSAVAGIAPGTDGARLTRLVFRIGPRTVCPVGAAGWRSALEPCDPPLASGSRGSEPPASSFGGQPAGRRRKRGSESARGTSAAREARCGSAARGLAACASRAAAGPRTSARPPVPPAVGSAA